MKVFKGYVFALSAVILASFGLQAMKYREIINPKYRFFVPRVIQNYTRMLGQIIKEQKKIRDLMAAGEYALAREVAGVGFKVGQANYWLRQNVKENLKSMRAIYPKLEKMLSGFFDLLDNFYDSEAELFGAVRFLNQSDLDRFNKVLMRLAQDKTPDVFKEMVVGARFLGVILPVTLIPKLLEAHKVVFSVGKMIASHFDEVLKARKEK